MPEQRVAWATMYGSYDHMDATSDAIAEWVTSRGLTPAGPMLNIFIVSGDQDPNPDHWVAEVNCPIV